jgi:hypothetical protein
MAPANRRTAALLILAYGDIIELENFATTPIMLMAVRSNRSSVAVYHR